jgi:hypothetical protein
MKLQKMHILLGILPLCRPFPMPKQPSARNPHTSTFGPLPPTHPAAYNPHPTFLGPLDPTKQSQLASRPPDTRINLILPAPSAPPKPCKSPSTSSILTAVIDALTFMKAPVDLKELLESTEFYLRTRSRVVRTPVLYDLACGHGLTGLLFAAVHPDLQVVCVDRRKPDSHDKLLQAVAMVRPHVLQTVTYLESPLDDLPSPSQTTASVIAVHACGSLTDAALSFASSIPATTIAAMPCCYTGTAKSAPPGIRRALGVGWAADIDRSYRLESSGYRVDFASIPSQVTPMNRIIIAELRNPVVQ